MKGDNGERVVLEWCCEVQSGDNGKSDSKEMRNKNNQYVFSYWSTFMFLFPSFMWPESYTQVEGEARVTVRHVMCKVA